MKVNSVWLKNFEIRPEFIKHSEGGGGGKCAWVKGDVHCMKFNHEQLDSCGI